MSLKSYRYFAERKLKRTGIPFYVWIFFFGLVACVVLLLLSSCTPMPARAVSATSTVIATMIATPTLEKIERVRTVYQTLTPSVCTVVNTDGEVLNIRKFPRIDAEIIGGLLPGAKVQVIYNGEKWLKIQHGQLAGYVFSKYCEVTK